ncbi:MAG: MFS transporter [Bryobacteraceae bacterium]
MQNKFAMTPVRRWSVVGMLCLGMIIAYVDRTNLSVAIADEDFQQYFNLSHLDRGTLNSAFFWSYAFLQIPAGYLVDRMGVKIPYAIGFLLWSLVSAGTAFATSVQQLFALRLVLGVGEAVVTPASLRWIRFNVDEKQRGLAVGLLFAGAKVGPAIGAPLAALLLYHLGWQTMFIVLGLGCLFWLVPWMLLVRNDDRALEAKAQEISGAPPVPFSAVFKTPMIWGVVVGTFCYNYFNYFGVTWLPSYFVDKYGVSLKETGWFTAFSFGGMAIVATLAGAVADRLIARGADPVKIRRRFTVAGFMVASTQVFGIMTESPNVALFFAMLSLSGLGLATANYWALTQTLVPGAAIGRIAGIQNFASNLSGIAASLVTGALKEKTQSYDAPMLVIFGLLILGALSYTLLVQKKYVPKI